VILLYFYKNTSGQVSNVKFMVEKYWTPQRPIDAVNFPHGACSQENWLLNNIKIWQYRWLRLHNLLRIQQFKYQSNQG